MGHLAKAQVWLSSFLGLFSSVLTRPNFPPDHPGRLTHLLHLLQQLTAMPLRTSLLTRNQQDAFGQRPAGLLILLL